MPLELSEEETVSTVIAKYEINAFDVDIERAEIIISYDKLDSAGVSQGEAVLIVDGPDFAATIQDASAIAGVDIYTPLKQALYNQITAKTGKRGTVS